MKERTCIRKQGLTNTIKRNMDIIDEEEKKKGKKRKGKRSERSKKWINDKDQGREAAEREKWERNEHN